MDDNEFVLLLNEAGQRSPIPSIRTERAVAKASKGQAIRVWTTDPGYEDEIKTRLGKRCRVTTARLPLPAKMACSGIHAGAPALRTDIRV